MTSLLQGRVDALEAAVGRGAVDLATQVAQLQATFAALQQKYPEFTELARRGEQLGSAPVSEVSIEKSRLSNTAKAEIVLSLQGELTQTAELLRSVQDLQPVLDRLDAAAVSVHQGHVDAAQVVYLDQQQHVSELLSRGQTVFSQYNESVVTLSSLFVQWDKLLTDLEQSIDKALLSASH